MLRRLGRRGGGGFEAPIGVVRIADEEIVSTPPELAARCEFPVLLPTYWPDESGEPSFALSLTLSGGEYVVRSPKKHRKGTLMVRGSPWRPGVNYAEDDMRPVEGMPWPTLMSRVRPGVVVVVKAPETRVLLFGWLTGDQALAVARSLEPVPLGP